ncbi:uncharacterized protein [Euphorbia lathyris]|uniref:uncharacterized protein isoform X3 n=1 Tax=Euphorbia lathyris TaxID=212925 RepID=UPI003313B112
MELETTSKTSMDRHALRPTAAIPATENTVWADASPLLEAACTELQDGELIHGDNFNLFAAMSALEATWHKGHSLAQTVFSCIYLLRPERTTSHPILDSFFRVIRATCKAVVSVVSEARTHEEEDLFTMAYGLPLIANGDEKCLSLLNAVEENISRQLRACKSPSSKRKLLEADIEPLQSNLDAEEGYCKSLLCRIRFRKHFFHVVTSMRRPQGRGMELARKHIAACISELESISETAVFLASKACDDGILERTTASGRQPIGFDSTVNSRTSAPTPPRSIELLSWKKAIEYFEKLLRDLDFICSYSLDPSLEVLMRFVVQFQKAKPDLVARAHLQVLLVQDGKLYGRDSTLAMIARAAGLPEAAKNYDVIKNEYIVQLGQLVINMLRILCTNAAWQRRKLGKILQDWRVIYVQLEVAFTNEYREVSNTSNDESLSVRIFKQVLVWVEEQTYWIAHRFLILGFELDLYSPGEYCMVYWYLYVILIRLAEKTHLKMSTIDEAAKRKGKKRKDSPKNLARESRIPPAVLFLQCQICIAEGLTLLLAALGNELMILQSPSPFNSEYERFTQHFELLQKACIPDHNSYPSFKESISYANFSTIVMYNYFKDAQKIAKEIKSSFSSDPERLDEVRRLEQVAEHNSIALNVICRVGAVDRSLKVSFEFIHHPCFATAVVKRH